MLPAGNAPWPGPPLASPAAPRPAAPAAAVEVKAPDNLWSRLRSGSPEVYAGYFLLAQMIEEIGVLCRSGYLDLEDINNFIGSGLQYCICLLMPHIAWCRATLDKSRTNWANLIWLAETPPRTPVYAKRGYGL